MPDTPGKVISSLHATAERRAQSSKLGGCTGVFFQFLDRFNGKRLFPRKLLPAERPKRRSKQHKDEVKLPMAKLLLIADENRGVCLSSKQPVRPEEVPLQKDKDTIVKANTKALNVVAKLMGLESMPFTESPLPARKQIDTSSPPSSHNRPRQMQTRKNRRKYTVDVKVSSVKGKPIQLHRNRLDRYPARHASHREQLGKRRSGELENKKHDASCRGALISLSSMSESDAKSALSKFSSPLPPLRALEVNHAVRSILSPSRTPLKLDASPVKSPLSPSKSAARLLEAAVKLLEPGIQPRSSCTKVGVIQPQTARKLLAAGKIEKGSPFVPFDHLETPFLELPNNKNKHALQHYEMSKQEKVAEIESGNRRKLSSCEQHQVPEGKLLRAPVKIVYQQQRARNSARMRRKLYNQESSHTVSHPDNVGNEILGPMASNMFRHPSPPNSSGRTHNSEWSSQSSKSFPQAPPQPSLSLSRVNRYSDHTHMKPLKGSSVGFGKRSNRMDAGRRKEDPSLVKSLLRKRVNSTETQLAINPQLGDGVFCDKSTKEVSVYRFAECGEQPLGEATCNDRSNCHVENYAHKEADPNLGGSDRRDFYMENARCAESTMERMSNTLANVGNEDALEDYGRVLACLECVEGPPSRLMLRGTKVFPQKGDSLMGECEPEIELLCVEECGQPSPVSILESPFQDAASSSSDGFENVQGRKLFEASSSEFFGGPSSLKSQAEDGTSIFHYTHTLGHQAEDEACSRAMFDCTSILSSQAEDAQLAEGICFMQCDKLMHSISSIHDVDLALVGEPTRVCESEEDYVKEILKAVKVSAEDVLSGRMSLLGPLLDPALFDNLEEWVRDRECGMSSTSGSFMAKEDPDGTCNLEVGLNLGTTRERRKLIFDCIDEALRLSLKIEKLSFVLYSYVHELLSPAHLFSQVYLQIRNWEGMAVGMNWNDMVEKETSVGFGSWFHVNNEVEHVVKDLESAVFKCLVEELVREVMSCKRWKLLKKKSGIRYKSPIKSVTPKSILSSKY